MTEKEILAKAYTKAQNLDLSTVSDLVKQDVDILIEKIGSNKSIVSALVTSLTKKIYEPKQDIRLHRTDFENGYSARVLDTQVISPFFKDHFPKYANKESSFLTLATRERIKWTKDEGENLKIRDKKLKTAFLNIFEQIEIEKVNPKDYLNYIFAKLIELSEIEKVLFENTNLQTTNLDILNIHLIIKMLEEHFETKQSSRLPVIAIYAIYEMLMSKFERYKGKKLIPLQVHTSSDKHGFGDIEVYHIESQPFEIIEIKHNIPIDKYLIFDIAKKTQNISIDRYYILTTFPNTFINS
ncbi:MAG: DNA methyltransferase [Bacteroidetes bacterium]|nr:MAG: DNA methyltransferase [Bacteroidota bacterium]